MKNKLKSFLVLSVVVPLVLSGCASEEPVTTSHTSTTRTVVAPTPVTTTVVQPATVQRTTTTVGGY